MEGEVMGERLRGDVIRWRVVGGRVINTRDMQ